MAVIAMGLTFPRLSLEPISRSASIAPSAAQHRVLPPPSASVSASSATTSSSSAPLTAIRKSVTLGGSARRRPTTAMARIDSTAESASPELKWWEKGGAPNLSDIHNTEEFVEAVSGAGDKLVIVEFYASWCGSCRALFPKFCKIATEYSDINFLKVNIDENRAMCKSLNVKVLPFFHFYRGTEGRLDAFSCSLSKLQKLRDAIAKYHDGPCEDCTPPEPFSDVFSSLLDGRSVR